ncbi:MAG: multi-sensor signal transduction histidine kinase [Elusimicrobia bacterium]|nr:MAG: multi-sensor signal transduction histidine kinase [Elusimicrobiota bacterium]KAF0157880.1 MAG: multi-sensor signal transduction histidine kinase [Elusimicrobiota bacterium]
MRRIFNPGLRFKLTTAFIALSALTVLSLAYFTIQHSYRALKTQKQQDELVIARNISAQVDEVLGKAKATISTLSGHEDIVSEDRARQSAALDIVTQVTELIDGIAILNLKGGVAAIDRVSPSTLEMLPPDAESARLLIDPVKAGHEPRFSPIFRSRSGEIVISIVAPILKDDRVSSVLAGFIILKNHTMGGIERIRIGKTGYAYIVDSSGNVIVHPHKERLLENFRDNPAVSGLFARKEGIIEFTNKDDVRILAAFARIEETGWGVVVRQPTKESYAFAERNLSFLVVVFVLSLAAALALGVYLARRISGPVTALMEGVNKVAAGDLEARIAVGSADEIGQLAGAFNDMTVKLRRHMEEVERAHAEVLKAQKQLLQSEKMAAIGQLAAGLAHEIYNPLNVISGFTELLLKQQPGAGAGHRGHLEEIYRETGRCQALIAELLRFAKPKQPDRAPADLGATLKETVSLLQAQARTRGVAVALDLPEGLPEVVADRDQLKQVFLNLLLNACQAMPSGGELSARGYVSGGCLCFEIKDTGVGIAPRDLDNIFNPFFTTKADGTGLGLALSYAVVESHGGGLTARSGEGKGAVFTLSLPLQEPGNEKTA